MSSFWERLLGRSNVRGTGQQAKDRLQFVLLHDRLNMSPERMEAMKQEILAVISKYVSIDEQKVDIALQRRDSASLLIAEVPFLTTVQSDADEEDADRSQPQAQVQAEDEAEAPPPAKKTRRKKAPPAGDSKETQEDDA
ncbi:MAG: cell division topological specificity factor MinE [Anaerolineae bacterium]|nr:cell division topological specificity factor MinE [Anaerolineae bacterium]MCA9907731.1 cell division topological specificity factor MinE [Anaerolineae bacterium]